MLTVSQSILDCGDLRYIAEIKGTTHKKAGSEIDPASFLISIRIIELFCTFDLPKNETQLQINQQWVALP